MSGGATNAMGGGAMNGSAIPWRPRATPAMLRRRAALLASIRAFFATRGVIEVDTPVLGLAGNPDPAIESLTAQGTAACHPQQAPPATAGSDPVRWLQTSPEFAMKRLLAAGSGDIYQLGHVFRGGENGRRHLPEFTLLEWYRLGFDEHRLMDEIEALLRHVGLLAPGQAARRHRYDALLSEHAQVCPRSATRDSLEHALRRHGVAPPETGSPEAGSPRALLDLLMGAVVGPRLGLDAPCFVHDYPADQAALAELNPGDPPTAARFELFVGGLELANGFRELTDAAEQRRRFADDRARREASGQVVTPLDEHLLAALAHGLPPCAGVALGVDRLLMALTGAADIRDVVPLWDDLPLHT